MGDTNKFKERYKYWKETGVLPYSAGRITGIDGEEQVYENGLPLPGYRGGKERLYDYLREKEGFEPNIHWDKVGKRYDIGYGFTDPEILKKYKNGMDKQTAAKILRSEVSKRVKKLQKLVPHWNELTENQQDSLTSYYYNFPFHNDPKNTEAKSHYSPKLFKALQEKNWREAARQMDAGMKQAPGLKTRRLEEQAWFLEDLDIPGEVRNSPIANDDYDYRRAMELGYGPDKNKHWRSRDYKTGRILKSFTHPTLWNSLGADAKMGYYPYIKDGQLYTDTWKGNAEFIDQLEQQQQARETPVPFKLPSIDDFAKALWMQDTLQKPQ